VAVANLGLRFGVELATYAALAYWGTSVDAPVAVRASLAVAVPLVAVVAWSQLLAPKAPRRLDGAVAAVVELSLFAMAAWALVASGLVVAGAVYGSLAVTTSSATRALGQYPAAAAGTSAAEVR
jgi:hypothetical protein